MSERPVLILFDDRVARTWEPLVLTRPAGELLFGCLTLKARAERVLGLACAGYLGCADLEGFEEPGAVPVLLAPPPRSSARFFLCSRAVPAWGARLALPNHAAAVEISGRIVGWYAPPDAPEPPVEFLAELCEDAAPRERLVLPGRCLEAVWDLVVGNSTQLEEDFAALAPVRGAGPEAAAFSAVGSPDGWLRTGRNVTIEPGVVLDFTTGPIWLADDVVVRAFTRLAGPAYIGPGSTVLGGTLSDVSVGPVCKVHGELEGTIVLGYSNKAHDGFLGHSYLGRWVNIGAQTANSNLKNNYGTIRVWTPAGVVDTGSIKLGCFLGDHVKTAIGTLLGTGTVVGTGSNLFGRELPPAFVPPFSWGSGADLGAYDVDRFLETATAAMGRRGITLSDAMRQLLRRAWVRGRAWAA